MSDLRFAFRQFAKSPGFSIVAVLTLALGIGANTAIFSVINAALLRPLPYENPEQLVRVFFKRPAGFAGSDPLVIPAVTGPQVKQWRDHATTFDVSIDHLTALNLIHEGRAERTVGADVSANLLQILRLEPYIGRGFKPGEDKSGYDNHVVMLTFEWWQSRFGGDPSLVSRTINFDQTHYTVIGILPPQALLEDEANFLIPVVLEDEQQPWRMEPENRWARVTARLKPGVTMAQAEAEASSLSEQLYATFPARSRLHGAGVLLRPLQEQFVENSRPGLIMLFGAAALVLLTACANISNLLLVRAGARQKEMAVRAALGAGAGRLVRQVLTESVVLSLLGGVAAMVLAAFGIDVLARVTAGFLPRMLQPTLDLQVLVFSLALACGSGVLFGLFPALRACRPDVNRDLKDAGRGSSSGGRARAQSTLIVAEVALTVMLLITSGLLLRSFARVLQADPGFNPHTALVCDVSLITDNYSTDELLEFQREILRRLEALPGVEAAATSTTLPLNGSAWGAVVGLAEEPAEEHRHGTLVDRVSESYFRTMGLSLLRGRTLTASEDVPDGPRVVVINERLAEVLMPGQEPVGRHLHMDGTNWEVVGVVNSVRHTALDAEALPHAYLPQANHPWNICLIVRTRVPPMSLVEDVRRVVADLDPGQALANFRTLEQAVDGAVYERRVTLLLVGLFAAIATGLAALGIYGVMTYTVEQRERELGIRMALGAEHRAVIRLVMHDGFRLGLTGIVAGLIGGTISARIISSRLYEVGALDPLVFVSVPAVLALVIIVSTYLPALRATRVDPLSALRAE